MGLAHAEFHRERNFQVEEKALGIQMDILNGEFYEKGKMKLERKFKEEKGEVLNANLELGLAL